MLCTGTGAGDEEMTERGGPSRAELIVRSAWQQGHGGTRRGRHRPARPAGHRHGPARLPDAPRPPNTVSVGTPRLPDTVSAASPPRSARPRPASRTRAGAGQGRRPLEAHPSWIVVRGSLASPVCVVLLTSRARSPLGKFPFQLLSYFAVFKWPVVEWLQRMEF